jgi:hypothetical protein
MWYTKDAHFPRWMNIQAFLLVPTPDELAKIETECTYELHSSTLTCVDPISGLENTFLLDGIFTTQEYESKLLGRIVHGMFEDCMQGYNVSLLLSASSAYPYVDELLYGSTIMKTSLLKSIGSLFLNNFDKSDFVLEARAVECFGWSLRDLLDSKNNQMMLKNGQIYGAKLYSIESSIDLESFLRLVAQYHTSHELDLGQSMVHVEFIAKFKMIMDDVLIF